VLLGGLRLIRSDFDERPDRIEKHTGASPETVQHDRKVAQMAGGHAKTALFWRIRRFNFCHINLMFEQSAMRMKTVPQESLMALLHGRSWSTISEILERVESNQNLIPIQARGSDHKSQIVFASCCPNGHSKGRDGTLQ
jgi:hypothetical protein